MPTPQPSSYCIDCNGPCTAQHLTGIPRSRVSSPSRVFSGNVVGKKLTDRKIEHYRSEGHYAQMLSLPKKTGSRCRCGSSKNVKHLTYGYLPSDGYWCEVCIDRFRKERDRARELSARIRAAMKEEYI